MAYSYKGSISFGFVYIPITLHTTIRDTSIGFNMLDKKTMSRITYKKFSQGDNREVKQADIIKGYEYETGKYVIFEDEDFEKIKTTKDKNITIEMFVSIDDIDPIFYDKPYYVAPTGAEKAYSVLLKAMEDENKVGIAKTILGNKETLVALRAKGGQMLLNTLFFFEEVQKNPAKDLKEAVDAKELKLAKAIIESMSGEFKPEEYRDEYSKKIKQAITQKIAGKEIVKPKESKEGKITDLMDALKMSLDKVKTPAKKTTRGQNYA